MNKKLNIVYFYNRPGWAFEFEARYYKKYSNHNVKIMLEDNFDNLPYNTDIAVLPSALHYHLIMDSEKQEILKRKGIKLIVQVNSHKELQYDCSNADLILASSLKLYKKLSYKHPKDLIAYQPHFVDTKFFKKENKYNDFTVGWVGDLKNPFKRSHLINKLNYNIKIKSDFKKSREENLLQQDMPEFYNNIDVLIILSESEGTPMVLLEAMSCGKPVISTSVGIVPEILHPFYVINSINEDNIIREANNKIRYLKNHPRIMKQLGNRYAEIIRKKYDWENNVHILDNIYRKVFEKNTKAQKFYSPYTPLNSIKNKLAEYIPIEFKENLEELKNTDYPVLLWNPHAYLYVPKLHWKYNLYQYRKKHEKPTYIVERGGLPSSIFIDRWGFLGNSKSYNKEMWNRPLSKEEYDTVRQYIDEFKNGNSTLEPQNSERMSKEEFYNKLQLNPNKKIVFVPMQVCKDTVIQLYSGWLGKMENLEPLLKEIIKKDDNIIFLLKNHPVEKNYKVFSSKNIKIVDDFHYKDCIAYSDSILTVNSSVGLQAMMWQKPVMIVGDAFYNLDDVNTKVNSMDEIIHAVYNPIIPSMNDVYRFIFYLKFVFYTHCKMVKTGNNSSKPLEMSNVRYENKNTGYMEGNYNPEEILENNYKQEIISVLIPVFNREKLIEGSLESILKQTYKDLEILIYNDGSTDRSLEICKELQQKNDRIKIIEGKINKGVAEARNELLKHCQTKYAIWHDCDDYSNVNRIKLQYDEIQKKERLIFGTWDNLAYHPGEWQKEVIIQTRPKPRPKGFATLMFPVRKDIVFDPNKKLGGEDWDWIERMRKEYDETLIPERVYYINFHADKIGQWKKVLVNFPGIDMEKMSFKEMQDFYREKTGKDIKDEEI